MTPKTTTNRGPATARAGHIREEVTYERRVDWASAALMAVAAGSALLYLLTVGWSWRTSGLLIPAASAAVLGGRNLTQQRARAVAPACDDHR